MEFLGISAPGGLLFDVSYVQVLIVMTTNYYHYRALISNSVPGLRISY